MYVAGSTNAADLNPPRTNECICEEGEGYFTRIDSEGNVVWTTYVAETWQAGAGDLTVTGGDLLGMCTHRTTGFMLLDGDTGVKKWYVNVHDMDLIADHARIDAGHAFVAFELDLRGNVCLTGTMVDQELINLTNEYGGGRTDGFVMEFTFRGVTLLPPPLPPAEGTASQVEMGQAEEARPTAAPVSEAPEVTQPVSAGEVGEVLAQPDAVVVAEPVGQPQIKDSEALPVESGQQEVVQPVEVPLPATTQSGQDEKAGGLPLQPEVPVVAGAESPAQVVECCVSGREAFELGDYQTAAAVFEKCIAENYEYLGRAYYKLGDYPQAAEILKKASALNPQEATLCGYLGSTYFLLKDNEQATPYLNKAVELNPSLPEPYYYLGVIAYQQKQYEEAIRNFQTSLGLNVGGLKPYVYMQLGWANHRLERYQEAEQAFLESAALDPTNANSYGGLGAVYYRLGDCSRSIPMYEKAIELAPNFQGWKDGLARCQE